MTLAIIGGTGLTQIEALTITSEERVSTPFGEPSAPYLLGELNGKKLIFLARHGNPHQIPPHKINYRANIWGLKQLGVTEIIGVAAVGGIGAEMAPAVIAIPDQLIDYSYGREHTFFADDLEHVTHIDFTEPYTPSLRTRIMKAAQQANISITPSGTYGCTQGPRLETVAEIKRMANDGCDLVGMTGMPEASLARELGLAYANISVVANWAAGVVEGEITMAEIEKNLEVGMTNAIALLKATVLFKDL
ncbi:5'-methylthioadenosine phosphorylase [Methylomonas methanica]|uniref:Probable S-methyl-5'-thioinosine phosphorylase n=1 Tax=Methylomonas methanica TaxID=421 RepID=A0A177MA76_METMH|nr:S-methyl-5'-thioinosine phosphorylase [Methylomonas methanica]OAI02647.1 5'-methylthioadenosine phosphorylase [Methylomonas methanica]